MFVIKFQEELRRLHWEDHYGYESPIEYDNSRHYRNNGLFDPYFYYVDYREFEHNRLISDYVDKKFKNKHPTSHEHYYEGYNTYCCYGRARPSIRRREKRIRKRLKRKYFKTIMRDDYQCGNAPIKSWEKSNIKDVVKENENVPIEQSDNYKCSHFTLRRYRKNLRNRSKHRPYNRPYMGLSVSFSSQKYGPYPWQKLYNSKIDKLFEVEAEEKRKKRKKRKKERRLQQLGVNDGVNGRRRKYWSSDSESDQTDDDDGFENKSDTEMNNGVNMEEEILNDRCFEVSDPSSSDESSDIDESENENGKDDVDVTSHGINSGSGDGDTVGFETDEAVAVHSSSASAVTLKEQIMESLKKRGLGKNYDIRVECEILFKGIPWINASKIPTMSDLESVLRERQRNKSKLTNKTQYNLDKIYVKIYGKLTMNQHNYNNNNNNNSNNDYTLVDTFTVTPYVQDAHKRGNIFEDIGINLSSNTSSNTSSNMIDNDDSKQKKTKKTKKGKTTRRREEATTTTKGDITSGRHLFQLTRKEEKQVRRQTRKHVMKAASTYDCKKGRRSFQIGDVLHDYSKSRLSNPKYSLPVDREEMRLLDFYSEARRSYRDGMRYNSGQYQARYAKVQKLIEKRNRRVNVDIGSLLYQATGNKVSVNRELYFVGQRCWEELIYDRFSNFIQLKTFSGGTQEVMSNLNDAFIGIPSNMMQFIFAQIGIDYQRRSLTDKRAFEIMMKPWNLEKNEIHEIRKQMLKLLTLYYKFGMLRSKCSGAMTPAGEQQIKKNRNKSIGMNKDKESVSINFSKKRLIWTYIDQNSEDFIENNVNELSLLDAFDNIEYLRESGDFVPFEIIHVISLFAGFYYCRSVKIHTNNVLFNEDELFLLKLYFKIMKHRKSVENSKYSTTDGNTTTTTASKTLGDESKSKTKGKNKNKNQDDKESRTDELEDVFHWQVNMLRTRTPLYYEMYPKSNASANDLIIDNGRNKNKNKNKHKKQRKHKKSQFTSFPPLLQMLPQNTIIFDEDRLLRSKNIGEMGALQGIRMTAREWAIRLEEIDEVYAEAVFNIFGHGDMDSDASDNDSNFGLLGVEDDEKVQAAILQRIQNENEEKSRFDNVHDDLEHEIAILRSLEDEKEKEKEKEGKEEKQYNNDEGKQINNDIQISGGLDDEI